MVMCWKVMMTMNGLYCHMWRYNQKHRIHHRHMVVVIIIIVKVEYRRVVVYDPYIDH